MADNTQEPLRSVHTSNLPEILRQLGISLVVSTYQAGKVVLVRADGPSVNTHFRTFHVPMGVALAPNRLAIGTRREVWELHNVPAVAQKLEPAGRHDACYLPRSVHMTGDIDIHEMGWGLAPKPGGGFSEESALWFVNTRFSCLCTLDKEYSFVPRWRPPFVSAYSPEDRCHLNGLGMVNGMPRYITALGESDTNESWRENKAYGGILMDITSNEFLLRGLSMPHSPRWYNEQLWFLESGNGSLARFDAPGKFTTVAQLPGFTRGVDFYGPLAFIGLSKVRDSALFSGIPLTNRLEERICGVWVVNIQTGETIAFLRFEEAVQEIFAVQVLPDTHFPDIIDMEHELFAHAYVLPDDALKEVAPIQSSN